MRTEIMSELDDMRQEVFVMQLIRQCQEIWRSQGLCLFLRPYSIISTGPDAGLMEVLTDCLSIDAVKKKGVEAVEVERKTDKVMKEGEDGDEWEGYQSDAEH